MKTQQTLTEIRAKNEEEKKQASEALRAFERENTTKREQKKKEGSQLKGEVAQEEAKLYDKKKNVKAQQEAEEKNKKSELEQARREGEEGLHRQKALEEEAKLQQKSLDELPRKLKSYKAYWFTWPLSEDYSQSLFALSQDLQFSKEPTWLNQLQPSESDYVFIKASTLQVGEAIFIFQWGWNVTV